MSVASFKSRIARVRTCHDISPVVLLACAATMLQVGCAERRQEPLPCLQRAVFGNPAESAYVLPYPVGASYRLAQSYCYPCGGHRDQLAYDFEMPIGETVTAARGGIVRQVRNDVPDAGSEEDPGRHNHIMIQHDDGTVALYAHLKQGGIAVREEDRVEIGQRIALSGNSGNTLGEPHLHFGVYQFWPATERFDVPVNFRNAEGPLDGRGGLLPGGHYKALPQ